MNISEYPPLLIKFLEILRESGWIEVQPNGYADNDLESNEYMIVRQGSITRGQWEWEVRFRGTACLTFHHQANKLTGVH